MSACALSEQITDAALDSALPREGLYARHLAGCATCRVAVHRVENFEQALARVAQSLVPQPRPAGALGEIPSIPADARPLARRQRLLAAAVALSLLATAVVVGQSLRRDAVGPRPPLAADRVTFTRAAAALIGVPVSDVVLTEDGAVGVSYDGARLALVLVRAARGELERLELAAFSLEIKEKANTQAGTAVTCPAELGLVRSRYLFGYSTDAAGETKLEGIEAVGRGGSTGTHVFAIRPGPIAADTAWKVASPNGSERGTGRIFQDVVGSGTRSAVGCWRH